MPEDVALNLDHIMPRANIKDGKLFYDLQGEGAALVLIPGFASGAWLWHWQVSELARSFKVLTFDPRGIASSDNATAPLTIESLAADTAALLDALEIDHAHLLGTSFGGFIAQEFALAFPERVGKLVLACTSFGGVSHVPPAMEVLAAFASTKGLNSEERARENLLTAFSSEFIENHSDRTDEFCRMRAENFVSEEVYLQQLNAAFAFDASVRVKNITVPTLILTGDKDIVVPPQNSYNLAAAIPGSELKTIAGGSHMFFVEQADEFNRTVTEFLLK
jgi:pimeloyl-ACP methyl ester carboxylesterase